eukprot:CAMPEP_0179966892 /NCGR_PEP_ID=MMETSP0983-20121128/32801_1 /TAXON_ID=483367 /ORGANISM="non described non described, Strain CCMP 2436" /LENGTH=126 /DNA_ID=CAMNT_0021880109 /DNA_START=518 /DNA_END=895 /DNA_ORIENTATION=-
MIDSSNTGSGARCSLSAIESNDVASACGLICLRNSAICKSADSRSEGCRAPSSSENSPGAESGSPVWLPEKPPDSRTSRFLSGESGRESEARSGCASEVRESGTLCGTESVTAAEATGAGTAADAA